MLWVCVILEWMMRFGFEVVIVGVFSLWVLWGCAAPTVPVRIETPEPVKIDVRMQVDVRSKAPEVERERSQAEVDATERRRLRMGEVQNLKNDRVVGENARGYLSVVNPPENETYLRYAQRIVNEENADRSILYAAQARVQSKPQEIVEMEFARRWQERAFPGELIQLEDGSWRAK
ncbi:MAG: YdbL family protein [Methylacidiphilales bacterium]|nr:YdbL family protein [Candidatus Methylacidiphilales bacterium]MDW8349782.1 DUF1318 domain-containing protein [Verrucomicrobiae bacterium]